MRDIKSLLKEARDAIKSKNYETSLKLCKLVLKQEKENYTALVFLAVSFQETGQSQQALRAFKEAIKANSTNPLAYNGLANYYEKIDEKEAKVELVKTYITLLKYETTEKKLAEYAQKLSCLHDYADLSEIVTALYTFIKSEKCTDKEDQWPILVDLLMRIKNLPSDFVPIYEESLKAVLSDRKKVCIEYYGELLNLFYKQAKTTELLDEAKKMHVLFEIDSNSLKWICKLFNEAYIEDQTMIETRQTIEELCNSLFKLESQSPTGLLTRSVLAFEDNQLVEVVDMLRQAIAACPGLLHAWIFLARVCLKLDLISDALHSLTKVEKLMKTSTNPNKDKLQKQVELLTFEVLSHSSKPDDLKSALYIFEKMDDETKLSTLVSAIRANINLGNFDQAKSLLEGLKNDPVNYKLLTSKLLRKESKYSEALDLLKEDVPLCEWWLEIGCLYWDSGRTDKSLMPFLKAAKLEPSNYKCFLFLGHFYRDNDNADKARRCYEKAFKLNSKCIEAGIELSKIYRKLKNWDANLSLLRSLTSDVINKNNCWAWMQLGLNYFEQKDYDKAVNSLRFVIRIDEDNMHCWESLADAYLAKGAYASALKCYAKASELSNSALYPLLQMANIKQILGEYVEARSDFEKILASNKLYVPALKGLAETCMYQARECFKTQRLGTARDNAQLAADYLITAIEQHSELASLWKLLGDSCYFVTKLPEKYCCLQIQASFVKDNSIEPQRKKLVEIDELFVLAVRCYCRGLSLIDDNILIWHDVGTCYLSYALHTNNKELFGELMNKAQGIALHCTATNPTNWTHWNLLGNVAFNQDPPNYRLAQHAFIKATIADNNSAVSWSNLGVLYFILNDYKLANDAFSQAQRSDPNFPNSWIGQALLAESLAHEDAMDLFRHSTQLGMHQQGALGYGHWVCKSLKEAPLDAVIYSIHNMHAVPVACDNLTWYTEKNPDDASAWNMLGILRERMGLMQGATDAFKNALALADVRNKDPARVNYGRLLVKVGRYQESIEIFSQVEAATFNSGSGLALALFKEQQYRESYEAYEQALHWLTDEQSSQSDLLVALASMAYMFDGLEAAKTLLFQSIQLEQPSPWGFFSTLSLGLLHNDMNLAQLVFKEMEKLKDRKDCIQYFGTLTTYLYLLKEEYRKSLNEISKLVHRHPDQAHLWLILSLTLIRLQFQLKPSSSAANCAQIAMKLGRTNMDVSKVLCLVSQACFIAGNYKNSLLSAQKAVHCYPNVAEGWAVLSSALLRMKNLHKAKVHQILSHVAALNASKDLTQWAQNTIRSF